MSKVDYDPNKYRRTYFARHPEKRMEYRTNDALSFLIRNYGAENAKLMIDEMAAHKSVTNHLDTCLVANHLIANGIRQNENDSGNLVTHDKAALCRYGLKHCCYENCQTMRDMLNQKAGDR